MARLPAQPAGQWGQMSKIVYGEEINILYWADESSQGRTKISSNQGRTLIIKPKSQGV
jgi:hypothetical protein